MLYIEQYYTIYWQSITLWFIGGEQEGKVETKSVRKRVEELFGFSTWNFLSSSGNLTLGYRTWKVAHGTNVTTFQILLYLPYASFWKVEVVERKLVSYSIRAHPTTYYYKSWNLDKNSVAK